MRQRSGTFFGLVVCVMMAASALANAANDEERTEATKVFRVENPTLDLGTVRAGEEVVATFVFHNETDTDVRIIHAKPT